eukprot:TRINITY_DN910_c0_g1_i1.p1 TRINITY_DN910_c0_g1~~TRINITY_DN910_c0_g1_i1.p1  ORF type:complete len:947 (-),score=287.15 TRINITY_DN910_c0_g1_i1:24-2864(-)
MGQAPSSLVDAIKAKQQNVVEEIITKKEQNGVNISYTDEEGKTALHWAGSLGQTETIRALLKAGANPELVDVQGCTPLTAAVFMGQEAAAEVLIDEGNVVIDAPNKDGMTPLHWAVIEQHYGCVELLIRKGANLSFRNNKGQTPADICAGMKTKKRTKMEAFIARCVDQYRSAARVASVTSEEPITRTDKVEFSVRIRRLVVTCKVWGVVKFMHPYILNKGIDWDAALIRSIPKINAASSSAELQTAMNELLSVLEDPNTQCFQTDTQKTSPVRSYEQENVEQPCVMQTDDGVAVLVVTHHEKFQDYQRMMVPFINCFKDLSSPKAKSVIFDVRLKRGSNINASSYPFKFMFYEAFRSTLLTKEVNLSAFRHRISTGYPQQKNFGNIFNGGMATVEGEQVYPNAGEEAGSTTKNWVFLINKGTPDTVIDLAAALQTAGLAKIVVEKVHGEPGSELGIATFLVSIGENLTVSIRKNERVNADGTLALVPDRVVDITNEDTADLPLQAAIELARAADAVAPVARRRAEVYIKRSLDREYSDMQYPNYEYRLLALFRFWNIIQYFFPYKSLADRHWDDVLVEFIPKLEGAKSALEYNIAVAELVANCCDSHSSLSSPILNGYIGTHVPPIEVKLLEGKTIITQIFDPSVQQQFGIYVGDEVIGIDNQNLDERKRKLAVIMPASTKQALNLKVHQKLLAGEKDSSVALKVRGANGNTRDISLTRSMMPFSRPPSKLTYSVLTEGYGYIDTVNLAHGDFEKALECVRNTPALILDIRGYPKGTIYQLAPRLTDKKVTVAVTQTPLFLPTMFYAELESCVIEEKHKLQPSSQWKYQGKIVALVNEETISHAEHSCLYLSACTDVTFVGTPTNGANGNVTNCSLPGGILVGFTGLGTLHGNKEQLQRKGIQPHVYVEPTVEGLRKNVDETLVKAIEYLGHKIPHKQNESKEVA